MASSTNSADFSEDEDVCISSSPLHDYLKDIHLDGNVISSDHVNRRKGCTFIINWMNLKEFLLFHFKILYSKTKEFLPNSDEVLSKMNQEYFVKYSKEMINNKLILEEDLDCLCILSPQQYLHAAKGKNDFSTIKGEKSRYSACLSYLVVFFASCVLSTSYILYVQFFLIFSVLYMELKFQVATKLCKRRHERNLAMVKEFIKSSEEFISLIRNSILLIQEIDLVSRGYTLVNKRTLTMQEKKILRTNFLHLRSELLKSLVNSTLSCREATLNLTKYKSKSQKFSAYLCYLPLSKLGICFTKKLNYIDMYQFTDGYSVAVLKSLNQIYVKQCSEFLTELSLILSFSEWSFDESSFISNFASILSSPNQTTLESLRRLQVSYDAHKNADFSSQSSGQPKISSTSVAEINLHSLQVHLRAALCRLIEDESSEVKRNFTPKSEIVLTIERHLQASMECWARCKEEFFQLDNQSSLPSTSNSTLSLPNCFVEEDRSKEKPSGTPNAISDSDEDFDDQIFEAVNDKEEENLNSCHTDVVGEWNQKHSASVIKELQSVLAFAASTEQRESRKCQLFPSYRTKCDKTTSDSNSPVSSGDKIQHFDESESESTEIRSNADIPVTIHIDKKNIDKFSGSNDVDYQVKNKEFRGSSKDLSKAAILDEHLENTEKLNFHSSLPETNKSATSVEKSPPNNSETATHSPDHDWTVGLGIGFTNQLALQAVSVASRRVATASSSLLTCGDDSSEED